LSEHPRRIDVYLYLAAGGCGWRHELEIPCLSQGSVLARAVPEAGFTGFFFSRQGGRLAQRELIDVCKRASPLE